ncbi:MAG: fimbrillin family protein [Paramuribaculum sp.]|nr:fimbrillin family protein [Paramuribaculum sp.]
MIKSLKYLALSCAALSCFSCDNEDFDNYAGTGVEITLTATREGAGADSRTVRLPDGSVRWVPGDEISVFYNSGTDGGSKFTCQNSDTTDIAEFKGTLAGVSAGGENYTDGKYLYAIYPYSASNSFNDGVATITLPTYQTAEEGSFQNGLFPTMARAQSHNLAFYNICGGVKFTVTRDDITSVCFKGNNGERLTGAAKVTFDENEFPKVLDEVVESVDSIIIYAPDGGTFKAGAEYYMAAYPAQLASGYTMTFRTSAMKEGKVVSDNAVVIERSTFGVLNDVDTRVTEWTDATTGGGGTNSGIYLGIVGFNQELYSYPIVELSQGSKPGFDSFINGLNMKNGTLLYYSVDQAINKLQSVPLPSDLSKVAIVTFTDGLDQGSMMMNVPYDNDNDYLNALSQRIKNETICHQPIIAYSIGFRGQDVSDVSQFRDNLKKLASSDDYATVAANMSEVNAGFMKIAEQLSQSNYVQTIDLRMPGLSKGTIVRFTFDNVAKADKSTCYIEGTFDIDTDINTYTNTYSLKNVKYIGLTSTSGSTLKGEQDGIFLTFTLEGVRTENNKLITPDFTDEWTYITSNNDWQKNSEADKEENFHVVTERRSAAIMLVLDCSSSLANDFAKAQNNAKDFINTLYEAVNSESGSGDKPSDNDNTIYSTTPKDLSLAVWINDTRYYLTKEEYDKANLSNAVVEGLTIISGGESFILSLNDIQTDRISSVETAMTMYKDILPTTNQGKIISAKWSDVNAALSSFGGAPLKSGDSYTKYYYYTKSTAISSSTGYFTNCIYGSGGNLSNQASTPYVRGVKPTTSTSTIYWTDSDDLKLSVMINGTREFLSKQEYNNRMGEIETVEGIVVIAGGEKFTLHLNDAQSGSISSVETAMTMYEDILPTANQGKIISAKWSDVNAALSSFGGAPLKSGDGYTKYYYYTKSTAISSSTGYFTNCIYGSGGNLSNQASTPYVRGVTNLE